MNPSRRFTKWSAPSDRGQKRSVSSFDVATQLLQSDYAAAFHLITTVVGLMKWAKSPAAAIFGDTASKTVEQRWIQNWSSPAVLLCFALLPFDMLKMDATVMYELETAIKNYGPPILQRIRPDGNWTRLLLSQAATFRERTHPSQIDDLRAYWASQSDFPALRMLFNALCAIAMSESSCERAFSAHDDMFHCRRANIKHNRLESQIFLSQNQGRIRPINCDDPELPNLRPISLTLDRETCAIIEDLIRASITVQAPVLDPGDLINFGEFNEEEQG